MSSPRRQQGFSAVDDSADAAALLRAMDLTAAWPAVQRLQGHNDAGLVLEPGHRVLDVGCGLATAAMAVAEAVAPGGWVLGLDASRLMVDEATRRAASRGLAVEFRVGDAQRLDLPDASFDACRSERTLQWVEEPARAVSEMVRVLRPGGRLGLIDTDWGTLTIDHPDQAATERVLRGVWSIPNPWSGRRLLGLCRSSGLEQLRLEADIAVVTEWEPDAGPVPGFMPFDGLVDAAAQAGTITPDEGAGWLEQLAAAARAGRFFLCVTMVSVTGRKPG